MAGGQEYTYSDTAVEAEQGLVPQSPWCHEAYSFPITLCVLGCGGLLQTQLRTAWVWPWGSIVFHKSKVDIGFGGVEYKFRVSLGCETWPTSSQSCSP